VSPTISSEQDEEKSWQEEQFSEILESWATKDYKTTPLKKCFVKKILHEDNSKSREKYLGLPILSSAKKEAQNHSKEQLENTSPHAQEDDDITTQNSIECSKYDDAASDKIYKILMGYSIGRDVSECWSDPESNNTKPPFEEDPQFALRNYLESEALPGEDQVQDRSMEL